MEIYFTIILTKHIFFKTYFLKKIEIIKAISILKTHFIFNYIRVRIWKMIFQYLLKQFTLFKIAFFLSFLIDMLISKTSWLGFGSYGYHVKRILDRELYK